MEEDHYVVVGDSSGIGRAFVSPLARRPRLPAMKRPRSSWMTGPALHADGGMSSIRTLS